MQTLKRTTAERSRALFKRCAVCTIGYGKVRFFMYDTLLYDMVRFLYYTIHFYTFQDGFTVSVRHAFSITITFIAKYFNGYD